MDRIKAWLKFAGKGEQKVAAVFGVSPAPCDQAVRYLRQGIPEIPVWLFTTREPWAETAALCERVLIESDSMALVLAAEKQLWPRWVVLVVSTWTGEHGRWPVKLAPFLVPPFRALLMNERPDFFPVEPARVLAHVRRRLRDSWQWIWNRVRDVHRGWWLLCLAWAAQWSSPVSRRAFRSRHGNQALELPDEPAAGDGTLVVRYAGRRWNRREIEERLRSSRARWVLLQEGGEDDDLGDLRPLFADSRTFAVARQVSYRWWHPMLFATAPFRQLQARMASRTLAPVSNAILMDRVKLLALGGIPDTVVPGSALFLIFWKAAAAGWRSYSGGGTKRLAEIQDWPYEEAEFVVRVLSDPAVRRLGPREPDLARGNIGFQVRQPAPRFEGRLTVLVISPYLPYPLVHGGAVRIYNLCRALSDRVDFVLASFREKDDEVHFQKLHEVFREVYVVDLDEKRSPDKTLPAQVREHMSRSMRALIAGLCRERRIDLMQVEFTHLAAFREAAPEVPAILVEHDLTFMLYRQLAQFAESERWLSFERRWFREYEAIWTMSGDDRARALEEGSQAERTFVVANGVDIDRFRPCEETAGAPELFYVGSFRHLPNILGFEKLRHEVMPRVWRRFPEVRLRVVAGPEPARYWREFLKREYPKAFDPRIQMHGFVEDLRPLYAKAALVLVPLVVSAGTNIKVMEAMACRKAVVTTPIGCAGLGLVDGGDAVIREDAAAFADAVCDLLASRERRDALAARARRTVEERFSWQAIAHQAYASYLKTAGVAVR